IPGIAHFFIKLNVDYPMIVSCGRDDKNDLREKRQFCKGRIWDHRKGRYKNQWIRCIKYL
ncbi:MAG TPA: hypothetical protein VKA92_08040, partial [Segetibacter sp.]|nr:hypothetical protein [Segetibacter sp.]